MISNLSKIIRLILTKQVNIFYKKFSSGYSLEGPCLRLTLSYLKVKKYSSLEKHFKKKKYAYKLKNFLTFVYTLWVN